MEDWKERLKAEYAQIKERYEKLKAWNNKRTVASELTYHTPCTSDADAAERRKQQYHDELTKHGAVDFFMGLWYDIMYGSMCYGLLPATGNLKKGEGKYVKPER